MPLRLCTLLLSADWSLDISPQTPKWTLRATAESHKHEQLMVKTNPNTSLEIRRNELPFEWSRALYIQFAAL